MTTTRTRKQATPADADFAQTNPGARKAPVGKPDATPENPCACGCGQATRRPTAKYVAGHDARHAGEVGRKLVSGEVTIQQAKRIFDGQPKLLDKAIRVQETADRKAQAKVQAAVLRAELAAKLAEVKAAHASK